MKHPGIIRSTLLIALITLSISCQPKKIDTQAETEKVMQTSRDWSKAAASGDVEKTLSYWTDDAVVISSGEPVFKGKEAIRGMVEESIKDPNFGISWEPVSAEISESGDMSYMLEDSKITLKDSVGGTQVLQFRTVTIWKKQEDGSWKCVVDVMSPKESQE